MIVTLSIDRFVDTIHQLEGINDSVEEIHYHLHRYAQRLFDHIAQFGLVKKSQVTTTNGGGLADYKFEINCGRDMQTNDFNWPLLIEALSLLNPVGVSYERDDIWRICDGLVGVAMNNSWSEIAPSLQRLTVAEVQPHFEAWAQRASMVGDPTDRTVLEMGAESAFSEAGVADPLQHYREVQAYREQEIEQAQQPATSWGVVGPDGTRY